MAKAELIKARELIEAGWVKYDLKIVDDGQTCYCLDGALAEAHGLDARNTGSCNVYTELRNRPELYADVKRTYDAIHTTIDKATLEDNGLTKRDKEIQSDIVDDIWRFNDRVATTKEDVIAVLDAAIEKAE